MPAEKDRKGTFHAQGAHPWCRVVGVGQRADVQYCIAHQRQPRIVDRSQRRMPAGAAVIHCPRDDAFVRFATATRRTTSSVYPHPLLNIASQHLIPFSATRRLLDRVYQDQYDTHAIDTVEKRPSSRSKSERTRRHGAGGSGRETCSQAHAQWRPARHRRAAAPTPRRWSPADFPPTSPPAADRWSTDIHSLF